MNNGLFAGCARSFQCGLLWGESSFPVVLFGVLCGVVSLAAGDKGCPLVWTTADEASAPPADASSTACGFNDVVADGAGVGVDVVAGLSGFGPS